MNLSNIISRYRTTDDTELELRFKLSRESFEVLFRKLMDVPGVKPELECSLNVISRGIREIPEDKSQYIRKISFKGDVRQADEYWRKERLATMRVPGYIDYSISLARETKEQAFSTKPDAFVRLKSRVSFQAPLPNGHKHDDGRAIPAGWRVDMTAIKAGTMAELGPSLKIIRNTMFPSNLSPANFFGPNLDIVTHYEVEVEHIANPNDPNSKNLSINAPTEVANWLFSLIDSQWSQQELYQDEIYTLAKVLSPDPSMYKPPSRAGLKRLSNQVRAINKNNYYSEIFPPTGYYLTEKTDGQRAICTVDVMAPANDEASSATAAVCKLVSGSGLTVHTSAKLPPKPKDIPLPANATRVADAGPNWLVVDGESVELSGGKAEASAEAAAPNKLYCLFDVMVWAGHSIAELPFSERQQFLAPAAAIINHFIPAKAKRFVVLGATAQLEQQIREVYEAKYPYEIDGLIMTEPSSNYLQTVNYKWKPLVNNTIDFLAVKAPPDMTSRPPYKKPHGVRGDVYLLFSGIRTQLREQLGIGFVPNYRQLFGIHGHRGESPPAYIPIQFCPSANPHAYIYIYPRSTDNESIDRKVVELRRNEANTAWLFVRVRSDRALEKNDFGNDFVIAEKTYMNYIDPFELADLWRPSLGYFGKTAPAIHTAPNRYKRYVIGGQLQDLNLAPGAYVIDEAAGRGADLGRYQAIGAKAALFIDIDTAAIAELIVRKFDFFAGRRQRQQQQRRGGSSGNIATPPTGSAVLMKSDYGNFDAARGQFTGGEHEDKMEGHDVPPILDFDQRDNKPASAMTVHTLVWDLKKTQGLTANVARFGAMAGKVNLIVCNFALHYMCDTLANIRQLLKWNAQMLAPGGYFMFSVMDGKKVFELLADVRKGESWAVEQDGRIKYQITKKYSGATLAAAGQTIGVLMSFADEPIDEPLCNIDAVVAEAEKLGFALERRAGFDDHFKSFSRNNYTMFEALTEDDRRYIGLYQYVVLRCSRS